MARLYWMDIPATNTTAQYPSNGKGGITTTATEALHYSASTAGLARVNFRFLGVVITATQAATNLITLTDAAGGTHTFTLPVNGTVGGFYPLPELKGLSPAIITQLGLAKPAQITIDGGIACGPTFTLTQGTSTTWAIRGLFTTDNE